MKKVQFIPLAIIFLIASCTTSENEVLKPNLDFSPEVNCEQTCSIIYYPNDPQASSSECGQISFEIQDGYYFICLAAGYQITEFIGWAPMGHSDYYTDFWSFDIRDNCLLFQPHHDLEDVIYEDGFRLDVVICKYIHDFSFSS